MIDDDSLRFTKRLLGDWKARAEADAGQALGRPQFFDSRRLVHHSIKVATQAELWPALSNFMWDVGIQSWGAECASIVTNCIYEITLNHLLHIVDAGPALIESNDWGVNVFVRGPKFGMSNLLSSKNGRGGQASLIALRSHYKGLLSANHFYSGRMNEWSINNILIEGNAGPCAIDVRDLDRGNAQPYPERLAGCDEIHIYVSDRFSFSNASGVLQDVINLAPGKPVMIHGLAKEPGLREYITKVAPQCRFSS